MAAIKCYQVFVHLVNVISPQDGALNGSIPQPLRYEAGLKYTLNNRCTIHHRLYLFAGVKILGEQNLRLGQSLFFAPA